MRNLILAWLLLASLPAAADPNEDRFELGGFAGVHYFSTSSELGSFDNDPSGTTPQTGLAFGPRLSFDITPRLTLEGELGIVPTSARDRQGVGATVFLWRAHVMYHFLDGKVRPFVAIGGGAMTLSSSDKRVLFEDTDAALHLGLGVKWAVGDKWGLRFDVRCLFPPSNQDSSFTEDFEALVGVYMRFGSAPAKKPAAVVDSDGDGIPDDVDKCPKEPEDKDSFEDADGCPDLDNDKDGIPDDKDKCPNLAENMNGYQDADGCPDDPKAADRDGDGIPNEADKCPDDPEDKDGFQDADGCPDLDNDNDGVPDASDKCPNEPETKNGFQDADGCPDELPKEVKKFTGAIKGINFVTGSAEITEGSHKILDEAAGVLGQYPTLRLEIAGHTDDIGARDFNMKLSQDRADSVKKYLVGKGIAEDRLKAVGYGPDKPINKEKTGAARAQNRRVEFTLVSP